MINRSLEHISCDGRLELAQKIATLYVLKSEHKEDPLLFKKIFTSL